MFDFILKSPAWQLLVQADWMTKFVLLCLFMVSVACIAIIFFKYKALKNEKNIIKKISNELKNINKFENLLNIIKNHQNTLSGKLLEDSLKDLKLILEHKEEQKLTSKNLEYLELAIDQHIDQYLLESETYLPMLGTSAAVSPLMGLFGTVWGLIHSFVNISQEKSADIAVVAPGIAEALTTTLAGLIVAIPAMIAFNYFSNEIKKQEQALSHIMDRYLNIIKETYLK